MTFFSLPKKMMLLLMVLFLTLSVALAGLWLSKTNQDFLLKQQEIRQQNHKMYQLLNNLFRNRFESWVELFVQLNLAEPEQLSQISDQVLERLAFMQLNWQMENVWLLNPQGEQVFSTTTEIPPYVLELHQQAVREQRSVEATYCQKMCMQHLAMPILIGNQTATISISYGLIEILAFLNQATQAPLGLVFTPTKNPTLTVKDLLVRGPMAKSQRFLIESLLSSINPNKSLVSLIENGTRVSADGEDYYIVLTPMDTLDKQSNYVFSAHNISPMTLSHESYQRTIIFIVFAVFSIAMLVFYLTTNNIRRRLISLASRLPKLAMRDYQAFQREGKMNRHKFRDELDVLNDSANELAQRLEKLDEEVQAKTSELEFIALYDQLTHLPNRNMLEQELNRVVLAKEQPFHRFALLFFDLDDFKKVNDSYGHSIGDQLLIEASIRIKQALKSPDSVFRLGGDEYAIMLRQPRNQQQVLEIAKTLLERFRQPINVESMRFYVSTSIGVAYIDSPELAPTEVQRFADIALYQAKQRGGNMVCMYDETMSQRALDKVALEDEARDALIQDHFSFALQPQIELATGNLIGFEALLRWKHPLRGYVPPGHFIPILENSEFMLSLGYWCIDRAFDLLLEFKDRGFEQLKIAINLAGIQFLDPDLIPFLDEKVQQTGIDASLLELELTERTLVADVQYTTRIMQNLINKGFLISIDDFGTGYSSLSYLKEMPAQFIKIDRSFIDGMLESRADEQIVASTVSMIQKLNMKVIAEGIEQPKQIEMLKSFGCDMAQGYHIARPIPEDELFATLEQKSIKGVWQY